MADFNFWEFIGVTGMLFGGAAFLMGMALAETWRPLWQAVPYGLLLAGGNHFIDSALFHGAWTAIDHYALDAVLIIVTAGFAHRLTIARKMVAQYPWRYRRSGLLSWAEKPKS